GAQGWPPARSRATPPRDSPRSAGNERRARSLSGLRRTSWDWVELQAEMARTGLLELPAGRTPRGGGLGLAAERPLGGPADRPLRRRARGQGLGQRRLRPRRAVAGGHALGEAHAEQGGLPVDPRGARRPGRPRGRHGLAPAHGHRGDPARPMAYNALVAGCATASDWAKALDCFGEMRLVMLDPDADSDRRGVMSAFARGSNTLQAEAWYESMLNASLLPAPTVRHFGVLIGSCVRAGHAARAAGWLRGMRGARVEPDCGCWWTCFNGVLQAYSRDHDVEMVESLLKENGQQRPGARRRVV
ncbi:unnamed protein product, partial [Prorocentrum cordatum]